MSINLEKIALTGNFCTGKSIVARVLKQMNLSVLEIDDLIDKLLASQEMKDILQDRYQLNVFKKDGVVNKKFLRQMFYSSNDEKEFLKRVILPRLKSLLDLWFYQQEKSQIEVVYVVLPFLFEVEWQNNFEQIWLVYSRFEDLLIRAQTIPGMTRAQAKIILAQQWPDSQKRSQASLIINNYGTIAELEQNVKKLLT